MREIKLGDSVVKVTNQLRLEVAPHGLFITDRYELASWEDIAPKNLMYYVVSNIYEGTQYADSAYWEHFPPSVLRFICASELGSYDV